MAYINSDVYGNGINDTILSGSNKVFIGLLNSEGKLLAFSELRSGSGTTVSNNEVTSPLDGGNFGTYSNSILNINKISYSRTASKVSDQTTDPQATEFAIIKFDGSKDKITAYEGSVFYGPALNGEVIFTNNTSKVSNCTILVRGTLSSPVTINASSNFMFAGATITFSAQDVQ